MKIIKNYLYNVGYQVLVMILPLITVPYIARVIGAQGVGINAYTNSIIQYFILFGSIGVNLYGNRSIAYVRDNKKEMSKVFWEITILKLITVTIAYLAFLIFLFFSHEYQQYFLYQSVLILAAGLDISWLFMGIEDFQKPVIRNMLVKIASVILIFSLVKTENDLGLYILITAGSIFIGNLTLWPYLRKTVRPIRLRKLQIWKHLRPSISLFIPQIAIQIYLVLNKTMLGALVSVTAAGYFDNADKLVKVILAVVTATGTVMLPRVAHTFAKGNNEKVNEYLYTSFDMVSLIATPMMFGLMAIAPRFAPWFFGNNFIGIEQLVMVLSPVILFIGWSNVTGQQYLMPTHKMKYFTYSVTVGAVVNLALNIIMIPLWGAVGACVATVVSEGLVCLVQFYAVKKFIPIQKMLVNVWKYLLSGSLMFCVVYYLNVTWEFSMATLFAEVMIGIILYLGLIFFLRPTCLNVLRKLIKR
ncbi:hypothetical protein BAU15_06865 [Enterococcus sp. JM4C]|uniref:flippase n=1 Tax=Candidatus Enterococcus huntleyi TaxID=1857217 RepID=UPI00137B716E|nr:flippase [Enterococcus sp. JM4C]KAF1297262.1 hypothetical protein BAU15_06865 [Enterococcus sp. JM4C]